MGAYENVQQPDQRPPFFFLISFFLSLLYIHQGRLTLQIEDAETERPFATAIFPLGDLTTKIRRMPIHVMEQGAEGSRRGAHIGKSQVVLYCPKCTLLVHSLPSHLSVMLTTCTALTYSLGEVFVQVLLRMDEQSHLRKVLAALALGDQSSSLLKSLHPEDAEAIMALVIYATPAEPKDPFTQTNPLTSPFKEDRSVIKSTVRTFQLDEVKRASLVQCSI